MSFGPPEAWSEAHDKNVSRACTLKRKTLHMPEPKQEPEIFYVTRVWNLLGPQTLKFKRRPESLI